ncbi:MAG: ATPase, T2SS/T4P/T4SS family [Pseudomonadota bacterium]
MKFNETPKNVSDPFGTESVCRILLQNALVTDLQIKRIVKKQHVVREKLERQQAQRLATSLSGYKIINPITIVDVITTLEMNRADRPSWPLDEEIIFQTLAAAWEIPYKKIDPLKLDLNLVTTTIPRTFAMKHLVLPIDIKDGYLTVATPNPFNVEIKEDIERVTHLKVAYVVSTKSEIIKSIDEFFGFKRSISMAEDMFEVQSVDIGNLEQYVKLKSADELPPNDHHIVNAVNHLLVHAFDQRASDIHIEPKRDDVCIRMRIDGMLHTVYTLPKKVHNAIVSRIKALSRLDMAEKRRPQDGRIKTDKGGVEAEIRVSTVPVAFGEKVVMRLMDPDILFQDLKSLGFTSADLLRYNKFVKMPHGIVLVCGPTGSGKSTTLYSTLRNLSTPEINITTIEDPIEMVNEEFNQIAVQPAIGVTFDTILRTILRQDPDIIMVGEMRDLQTAASAVQAALTGHLVLSTIHTNDAPSVITRLLDLGVPSFLIQATLVGILAQRLVRVICEFCKEPFEIDAVELKGLGLDLGKKGRIELHHGTGCIKCRNTGYRGRLGIFEVLPFTESIKRLTTSEADVSKITQKARDEGMVTLRENAVTKLMEGVTTYQEVLRVTWEQTQA